MGHKESIFKKLFLLTVLERGRERNIHVRAQHWLPPACLLLEIEPATLLCTGPHPTEPQQPGQESIFRIQFDHIPLFISLNQHLLVTISRPIPLGAIFSKQKDNSVIHCFLEKGSGGEVRFSTLIHALTALPSDPNVILTIFPLLLSHCSTDNAPGHFEHFTGVNCFYCSEIHITELTILTDTIQWHLVHSQCSTVTTSYQVPKHFHHPTAVTPHCCLAPAPGKHQSTFYLSGLASCEH